MRSVLFSNEVVGLGHLRISLSLARALAGMDEDSTALVVTGYAGADEIRLPPRVSVLRLPAAPVSADPRWGTTALAGAAPLDPSPEQVLGERGERALRAVREIDPHVVVVDYTPLGRGGDLRAALEWLRESARSVVALGLRDFDDDEELRSSWDGDVVKSVRRLYDLALIYNDGEVDDVRLQALRTAGVVIHRTGLVGEPTADAGPEDVGDGYLLVTAGGGIDAVALLELVLDALRIRPLAIPALLVAGPMMPVTELARLRDRARGVGARVEHSRSDMDRVLAGARAIVSMAGYATVAEILASGKPALLVPRSSPREEQLNRARYWAGLGRVRMLAPERADPVSLAGAIAELLTLGPGTGLPLCGANDVANILAHACRGPWRVTRCGAG